MAASYVLKVYRNGDTTRLPLEHSPPQLEEVVKVLSEQIGASAAEISEARLRALDERRLPLLEENFESVVETCVHLPEAAGARGILKLEFAPQAAARPAESTPSSPRAESTAATAGSEPEVDQGTFLSPYEATINSAAKQVGEVFKDTVESAMKRPLISLACAIAAGPVIAGASAFSYHGFQKWRSGRQAAAGASEGVALQQ